ncbi:MAG: hypothetical protein HND52_16595 [Ignavibacteriae bacterium]|nr:hypothetical protein [Ignavibacteriota bacterium]NOG99578.1 hypothetical protein [Ignavibacteriota bacterium]
MIDRLSNYIIRAYKKRDGKISFHLRSHLFVKSNSSFSVSHYLNPFEVYFILPSGEKIIFDDRSVTVNSFCKYDGEFLINDIHLKTVTNLTNIKDCLVDLYIQYGFFHHPCLDLDLYKSKALVRWMY